MSWKFWEKPSPGLEANKPPKLPRPKDVPPVVGQYMVVNLGLDPDWVWRLKGVTRPQTNSKSAFDIRIFDEANAIARKVSVRDFNTLNDHPLLIVYEGWFDKVSGAVKLEKKTDASAPLRSAA
jgi:hypothetical protein